MGKKYIIELLDDCPSEFKGIIVFGLTPEGQISAEPIPVEDLTPYTEPDLEQVRADAYNDGYKSGREAEKVRQSDLEQVKADAYLKGLNDGQGVIIESTQNNAFNNGYKKCLEDMEHDKGKENSIGYKIGYKKGYVDGLNRISDYEDKIRKEAYQQGLSDAEKGKATCQYCEYQYLDDTEEPCKKCCNAYMNKYKPKAKEEQIQVGDEVINRDKKAVVTEITDRFVRIMYSDGSGYALFSENMTKTGRNFPEIAEVLEKMRGEQDG